jgi:hypothetical protein
VGDHSQDEYLAAAAWVLARPPTTNTLLAEILAAIKADHDDDDTPVVAAIQAAAAAVVEAMGATTAAITEATATVTNGFAETLSRLDRILAQLEPPAPGPAAAVRLTIRGDTAMGTFNIDGTGTYTVDFSDRLGEETDSPADLAAPVVTVDDTTLVTVGAATESTDAAGHTVWTGTLTPLKAGSGNASVDAPVDSAGNPVNGPDGNPIPAPAPVAFTVDPGAAAGEVFTVA